MKYVFGPVPSRRLGQSLGIDPVPLKTCNWNCVYCQLGRSVPLRSVREEYFPSSEIVSEVRASLAATQPGQVDWITFVGSGETTLHSGIGQMIREVKRLTDIPVAVITNGSLLYLNEVCEELQAADAVLPSLDAGNAKSYWKINRPWPELTFDRLVEGLSSFRKSYQGSLWVEVMLVRGLNDSQEVLLEIGKILNHINPDQIHINVPSRPPAESWVQPPTKQSQALAKEVFGEVACVIPPASGMFDLIGDDPIESILTILTRHPMRERDLLITLWSRDIWNAQAALEALNSSGRVQIIERLGERFWTAAGMKFPEDPSKT